MIDTFASSAARAAAQATQDPIAAQWCVGILSFGENGESQVLSGAARLRARRAASCLLVPDAGDSVACLRIAPDEVWIMAVLQREDGASNVLSCAGGLRIEAQGGTLALQAAQVDLEADALQMSAQHATLSAGTAEVVGRQLTVAGTTVKLVGSALSTVMDRVQHFSRHYLRTTDGTDRVAATHVEVEAKQLMRLEGEHALVNGRELIKARGAQIHFG